MVLIQTKIQIDRDDYNFIKKFHKKLNHKSQSEYIRSAVRRKVDADRLRLRAMKRKHALELIGDESLDDHFESIGSEDVETG